MSDCPLLAVLSEPEHLPAILDAIHQEIPPSGRLLTLAAPFASPLASALLAASDAVLLAARMDRPDDGSALLDALRELHGLRPPQAQRSLGGVLLWGPQSQQLAEQLDHPSVTWGLSLSARVRRDLSARIRMSLASVPAMPPARRLEASFSAAAASLQARLEDARRRCDAVAAENASLSRQLREAQMTIESLSTRGLRLEAGPEPEVVAGQLSEVLGDALGELDSLCEQFAEDSPVSPARSP